MTEVHDESDADPAVDSGYPVVLDPVVHRNRASSSVDPSQVFADQRSYIKSLQAEYHITQKVVAVLAEQLLKAWGKPADTVIKIDDEALLDCPELQAWRDNDGEQIHLQVKRPS